MNKKIKKNKKGFTLVEMIVVIAIIGVLAAMMVPSLLGYIEKAHTSNNRAAAVSIGRAAETIIAEDSAITDENLKTKILAIANGKGTATININSSTNAVTVHYVKGTDPMVLTITRTATNLTGASDKEDGYYPQ